jgi:hypothetical protein
MTNKGKLTKQLIVTSRDIIKGAVTKYNNNNFLLNVSPWQMVSLEEKTNDWFKWNMDWFESIGWVQMNKEHKKAIKNRKMAAGILDPEDYTQGSDYNELVDIVENGKKDPLQMFYPLAPPVINVLRGEFMKRDNKMQITCVDPQSISDKLEYKESLVQDIIMQNAIRLKQQALEKLGISQTDPNTKEQYNAELENTKKLQEANKKFQSYKHRMEEWGQHIINVDSERFNMDELELEAFTESLCNSKEFWHIDLLEDDYKIEFLDTSHCFWHKSHNIKYISDGDYFGWFQEMTPGDIINKLGRRFKKEDFEHLREILSTFSGAHGGNAWLTNDQKAFPGAYYDTSKPYPDGRQNIPMEQAYETHVIEDFMKSNFENYSVDQIINQFGKENNGLGQPKLFRVLRVYWKSQKQVGWLTKIGKDGITQPGSWIDENFKVTEEPIYDFTINKDKTVENLVYGEHVDWTWVNEWRHGIKITQNTNSTHWSQYTAGFEPIYLDGEPVKFQFKGKNNPFESYPPVEGCEYKMKGLRPVSLIDLLAPYQISLNICENRSTGVIVDNYGKLLYHNQATIPRNRLGVQDSQENIYNFYEEVRQTKILPGHFDKEVMAALGPNASQVPQVVDMSIIQDAITYKTLSRMIKEDALETVGVTRQRLGQQKASETATGVQAGVNFSESQTEIYFNQHSNELMPRVYQRMLEAAQFYHYQNKNSQISYRNDRDENVLLDIENLDNLLRDFNIKVMSKPRIKQIKQKLEQLFLTDNTLEATALDRANVIYADSAVEIMEKLRKAQIRKDELDQQRFEQERQSQEQAEKAAQELKDKELRHESSENQLDRDSDEYIAQVRALGGMQTDSNTNLVPDAQDNLNYLLKQSQMDNANTLNNNKLDFDKKKHSDNVSLKQQEMLARQIIEQKKLAASIANQTSKDDKALNKAIAKKQGVTK